MFVARVFLQDTKQYNRSRVAPISQALDPQVTMAFDGAHIGLTIYGCLRVTRKALAYRSNSFSKTNGECVAATRNPHLAEFMMSGRNFLCHSTDRESSGSSMPTSPRSHRSQPWSRTWTPDVSLCGWR